MTLPETVSWLEIVWTAPAALALVLALWMQRESWYDLRHLRRQNWNGVALVQARAAVRGATLTVIELGIMTAVGVVALTQPQSLSSASSPPSLTALAITLVFIGLPCLLFVREVGNRRDRVRINRLVRGEGD
jgi:hypothetical protein